MEGMSPMTRGLMVDQEVRGGEDVEEEGLHTAMGNP